MSRFSLSSGALILHGPLDKFGNLVKDESIWHNTEDWGIEGKGWVDTLRYFDRLPAKAEHGVEEAVWNLSRHSAGMSVRFETDATEISIRYTLLSDQLAMANMPATGVSGIDLYVQDAQGTERWLEVTRPEATTFEGIMVTNLASGPKKYTAYLPLYNGVESLEFGVPRGATFSGIPPRTSKPMVFYGTSILHGACASRPGMAFPSILARRLQKPFINLGFAGRGRMQPEVGELLAELDPSLYAIDCLPNMDAQMVRDRTRNLVHQLRQAHPDTPIILVEDRMYTNATFLPARSRHHRDNRLALRKVMDLTLVTSAW